MPQATSPLASNLRHSTDKSGPGLITDCPTYYRIMRLPAGQDERQPLSYDQSSSALQQKSVVRALNRHFEAFAAAPHSHGLNLVLHCFTMTLSRLQELRWPSLREDNSRRLETTTIPLARSRNARMAATAMPLIVAVHVLGTAASRSGCNYPQYATTTAGRGDAPDLTRPFFSGSS